MRFKNGYYIAGSSTFGYNEGSSFIWTSRAFCENLSRSELIPLHTHTIVVWTDIVVASLTIGNHLLNTKDSSSKG